MQEDFPTTKEIKAMMARADMLVVTCTRQRSMGASRPRTSPVFCAASYHGRYYWLSHPNARHSFNIARSHRGTLMALSGSDITVTGSIGRVGNPVERQHAYDLLKTKARTLPEQLNELGQVQLRDIYCLRADGTDHKAFNAPNYAVLGTVGAANYEGGANPLMQRLDFAWENNALFVKPFAGMFGHNIHACLFDSQAKQGTGIGVYFDAKVLGDESHLTLSPSGEVMVNGALFDQRTTGWIDQTRPVVEPVFA